MPIVRLAERDRILAAAPDDPFVGCEVPHGQPVAFAGEGAVALVRTSNHTGRPSLTLVGPAAGIASMLSASQPPSWAGALGRATSLTVPSDALAGAERVLALHEGADWQWLWTRLAPPVAPGESRVVDLGGPDRDELQAFLSAHNPRTHGRPFDRADQQWVGIRDEAGHLIASGCDEPSQGGVAFLAGISVHGDHRGRGLGRAISTLLTRRAVARDGVCTLGMYADNDVARRLYTSLGYAVAYTFASRRIIGRR